MADVPERIAAQALGVGLGAAAGVIAKQAITKGPMSARVGSAVGATLATGGTVGAALGSGVGAITAPAIAMTAATSAVVVAALPFVAAGAAIVGGVFLLSKIFED